MIIVKKILINGRQLNAGPLLRKENGRFVFTFVQQVVIIETSIKKTFLT